MATLTMPTVVPGQDAAAYNIYVSNISTPQPLASARHWYERGHYIYDCVQQPVRPGDMEGMLMRINNELRHPTWAETLGEDDSWVFIPQREEIEKVEKQLLTVEKKRAKNFKKRQRKAAAKRAKAARKQEAENKPELGVKENPN